jgi:hypothetical protein
MLVSMNSPAPSSAALTAHSIASMARPPPALAAALEEQLEAEAHAEERRAGRDALEHRGPQAGLLEPRGRVAERADAGQHHAGGAADLRGALRDAYVGPAARECLGDAGEVAHAVVDDGDARRGVVRIRRAHGLGQSVPLVDGTASSRP